MKKVIILFSPILASFLLIFFSSAIKAPNETEINFSNIRSTKGQIIVQVFNNEETYDKQVANKKILFDKKGLKGGTMNAKITLEPGIYALTVIDDEDFNGKLDKNMIGIPKEGFGFSNFFMEKLQKPKFDQIKVNLQEINKVTMRIKYM